MLICYLLIWCLPGNRPVIGIIYTNVLSLSQDAGLHCALQRFQTSLIINDFVCQKLRCLVLLCLLQFVQSSSNALSYSIGIIFFKVVIKYLYYYVKQPKCHHRKPPNYFASPQFPLFIKPHTPHSPHKNHHTTTTTPQPLSFHPLYLSS